VVRWAPPASNVWVAPPPSAAAPPPSSKAPVDLGPSLSAPPPVLRSGSLTAQCPSCHTALVASTSSSLNVCPQCGRLFSSRTASSGDNEAAVSLPAAETPAVATTTVYSDRLSQELLAAYVTARPIPCPRCRTHLRHRGVSEYSCPSCGETVRFGAGGTPSGSPGPRAPMVAPAPGGRP